MTNVITLPTNPFTSEPAPDTSPIHVMLDTETLGLEANAIILSIGAVTFYEQDVDGWMFGEKFYTDIDPTKYPGAVDLSTIKFWMEQSAKGTACPMNGTDSLPEALDKFHSFLLRVCDNNPKRLVIWANGTDFDIPKISYAYKVCSAQVPWGYNSVRDARTVYKLYGDTYGLKLEKAGHHNALSDAIWQTEWLISIFKNLAEKDVYVD